MTYEIETELSNQAFAQVEAYLNAPWDGKDIPVLDLVHNLLISILKEYQHLKFGCEKDTALEAWACRNPLGARHFTSSTFLCRRPTRNGLLGT
jgi:hypothetical protein